MANTITVSNDTNTILITSSGPQGVAGVSGNLQAVTDAGNTTTNDIIQLGGKIVAPEFETSGATISLTRTVDIKVFGTELEIDNLIKDERHLEVKVPLTDSGTSLAVVPDVGALETAIVEGVFTDLFTGSFVDLGQVVGTINIITSKVFYKFQDAGKIVKIRTIANNGDDTFDLFGTSADPYFYFTTSVGDNVIDLLAPIETDVGFTYNTTLETEDGSPLNILGQANVSAGPTPVWNRIDFVAFDPFLIVTYQTLEDTLLQETIEITTSQINDFNDADYEHIANKGIASGYAPLNSGANVPAVHINENSVTQHEDALEITQSQITDLTFPVDSVNGKTGTVVLDADDVGALQNGDNVSELVNDAGYITGASLPADTDDLPEGSLNLYYTESRVSNNSDVVANTSKNSYPSADATKLAGIEALAEVNQTDSEIKTQYENNANTNAFTDSDVINLDNQSGTNTGDQDLSGLALKSNVLELDNTDAFTPDADYEPATKKYVDDNAGLGYILATWGANLQNSGRHPAINGAENGPEIPSLGVSASAPVPAAGTIDTITYYNTTGDNTTEFQIIKNGVVMHTFTCVGPYGAETGINVPTGFVGNVPDNIAIRYTSGTAPGPGFYSMYIK